MLTTVSALALDPHVEAGTRLVEGANAEQYLKDDAPAFDIGGFVVGESEESAVLLAKSKCTLAGVPLRWYLACMVRGIRWCRVLVADAPN